MRPTDREDAERVAAGVADIGGYVTIRVLPDNTVAATYDLMYTRAIMLDLECNGCYGRRFCFEDRTLAEQRLQELQSSDDEPQGYIARRT